MQYRIVKASRKRRQQNQKTKSKIKKNAIFGKSIENPMNKFDCNQQKKILKMVI